MFDRKVAQQSSNLYNKHNKEGWSKTIRSYLIGERWEMKNLFTWADPERELVVALLTTGKPVLGTHMVALVRLFTGIHETFART